jgi:hypothetical protein
VDSGGYNKPVAERFNYDFKLMKRRGQNQALAIYCHKTYRWRAQADCSTV